jgi:predicted transcriptional regulator
MTSIRIDVNEEELKQVDKLAELERWSRRKVVMVALEYYLKLRKVVV